MMNNSFVIRYYTDSLGLPRPGEVDSEMQYIKNYWVIGMKKGLIISNTLTGHEPIIL